MRILPQLEILQITLPLKSRLCSFGSSRNLSSIRLSDEPKERLRGRLILILILVTLARHAFVGDTGFGGNVLGFCQS